MLKSMLQKAYPGYVILDVSDNIEQRKFLVRLDEDACGSLFEFESSHATAEQVEEYAQDYDQTPEAIRQALDEAQSWYPKFRGYSHNVQGRYPVKTADLRAFVTMVKAMERSNWHDA